MDATAAPPSTQPEPRARFEPGVSAWWGLIAAFSVLLLILASLGQPDEALRITGAAAAIALTVAFGVKLRDEPGPDRIYAPAAVVALAASAAFEVGATWLQIRHSPWPPPSWMMLALLAAATAWLAAAASHLPARTLPAPLIEALLPGSMLAFAALYAVPSPVMDVVAQGRLPWMLAGAALALSFAASSLTPMSVVATCATLGAAGVLLGSLGGATLAVVLGNAAFVVAGCASVIVKPAVAEARSYAPRTLKRIDLLLAPALVLLVFVAILLHGSGDGGRHLALRLCAGAALVLLLARQVALLWSQRRDLAILDVAHRDLSERASLDALTQLPNRDALLARLHEEVERARRYNQPLSLCFVDVDLFKSVNDRFGHAAGDAVLRRIAATLRVTARSIDFVGRYGGEEFLVIAPGTLITDALMLGERLRVAVEETTQDRIGADEPLRLTISAGLAEYPANARTLDQLLERADAALYASKRSGRNRVTASQFAPED